MENGIYKGEGRGHFEQFLTWPHPGHPPTPLGKKLSFMNRKPTGRSLDEGLKGDNEGNAKKRRGGGYFASGMMVNM